MSENKSATRDKFQSQAYGNHFVWKRGDLTEEECFTPLPASVEAELNTLAKAIAGRENAVESLDAKDFDLPETKALMAGVSGRIFDGIGFTILDRLPVERWGIPVTRAIAWMLTGCLGHIVEQKYNGTRIYDVRDTGKTLAQGVRRSITNLEQEFHTDGGWLPDTPEVVALTCLQQAQRGGMSRVSSLATAHDAMLKTSPEELALLYRPMWWDRQKEHGDGDRPCHNHPIFTPHDGGAEVRYYDDYVRQGHRLMNTPLDDRTDAALRSFRTIVETPEHCFDLYLKPGQIEFVNNRVIAHARTQFEDSKASDQGRHLVRLWVRRTGGIALEPAS